MWIWFPTLGGEGVVSTLLNGTLPEQATNKCTSPAEAGVQLRNVAN